MLSQVADAVVIVEFVLRYCQTTLFTSNRPFRIELAISRVICPGIEPDDLLAAMLLVLALYPKIHYYEFSIS